MHTVIVTVLTKQRRLFGWIADRDICKSIVVRPGDSVTIKYRSSIHHRGCAFAGAGPGTFVENIRQDDDGKVYLDISCPVHESIPDRYTTTVCVSDIVDIWKAESSGAWGAVSTDLIARSN